MYGPLAKKCIGVLCPGKGVGESEKKKKKSREWPSRFGETFYIHNKFLENLIHYKNNLLCKTKHHHSVNIGAYVETIPSTISLPLTPISNELIMLMTSIY